MMARHPNRQQLTSWLNGDHEHLGEHIDDCPKCASKLDELDSTVPTSGHLASVEAISAELRPALLTLLEPPEDLHERISARITSRLRDRDDANLFGSLLGIPIEAGRIVLDPSDNDDE